MSAGVHGRMAEKVALRGNSAARRSPIDRLRHADRFRRLSESLLCHASFWRSLPYREIKPQWACDFPLLEAQLLALPDEAVARLAADPEALIRLMSQHDAGIAALAPLIRLNDLREHSLQPSDHRSVLDIPGRKLAQIQAFAGAMGKPRVPLVEWCSGKGHFGRLLAIEHGASVLSVDHDPRLCQDGARLARRARVLGQTFHCADVLSSRIAMAEGRHAVALHACGDLHVALVRAATAMRLPALDVSPCCYHKSVDEHVHPLHGTADLVLSREERRMAVSDVATSSAREIVLRQREAAYRLGLKWLLEAMGVTPTPLGSVPAAWLQSFEDFCRAMCPRLGIELPARVDWDALEREGIHRCRRAARLSLARLAFRRPLEIWMALDRACYLEERGYEVRLGEFCSRSLTPRNLLLSARAVSA